MPVPSAPPSDHDDLAAIRSGDQQAFEAVYVRWFDVLWRYASRYVGADTAEEVVQDVFLALWRTRATWDVHMSVRAYLFGAVRNRALHRVAHDHVVARTAPIVHDPDETDVPSAADQVERDEARTIVARVLAALPERQRAAMELRLQRGLSYAEIGEALGVSAAAAGKLVTKATEKLQAALTE